VAAGSLYAFADSEQTTRAITVDAYLDEVAIRVRTHEVKSTRRRAMAPMPP